MTRSASSEAPGAWRMTVLVTGGTGFLGASLTRRLLSEGARVRVLARSRAKARPLADLGAEIVAGDMTDQASLRSAVDGVQAVYHLAGPLLVPGIPATEYRRTHVAGTELLLACCEQAPGLERFVHCSTTGVLGVTGDRPAGEDAPFRPTNMYEQAKADAETAVRSRWRHGFPAVVARPGLVYGPGDIHLVSFFQAIFRRRFRPIGRRDARLHPIYIDDMTEALLRCGQRSGASGECFHLAGPEPVAIRELADVIARAEGVRLPSGHIPLSAARALAGLGDLLPPGVRQHAPLTRSRLEFLTHSRVYDVSKAARLLDFAAATDLSTGVARTVAWYRQRGYLPPEAASRDSTERGVAQCEFGITSLPPPRVRCWRPLLSAAAHWVCGPAACSSTPTTTRGTASGSGASARGRRRDSSIKPTPRSIRRRARCTRPLSCSWLSCWDSASGCCCPSSWAWACTSPWTQRIRLTWTGRGPRPWRGTGIHARRAGRRRRTSPRTSGASRRCCRRIGSRT